MIRILIETVDTSHVVHGNAPRAQVTVKSFDVDLPEVEAELRRVMPYGYVACGGVELLDGKAVRDGR